MIIFEIILMIVFTLGSIIFLSNGIAALMYTKQNKINNIGLFPNSILVISGFINFFMILFFLLLMLYNIETSGNKKELKYELIQTPLYKQIK